MDTNFEAFGTVASEGRNAEPLPDPTPATTTAAARPRIVCRQIREDDLDAAVACLSRGFPERSTAYWRRAFLRLRERVVPEGRPRYGYVMAAAGEIVGIVLVIVSTTDEGTLRANVSSWFVEPAYRGYSNVLLSTAFRAKDVTFLNISPAPSTVATIIAQGYVRYVEGTFHTVAAMAPRVRGAMVRTITAATPGASPLLAGHAACGCLCFEVVHAGLTYPFVFVPLRIMKSRVPAAQLVYCRAIAEFVRFAGPLGRALARIGLPFVMIDATGPIEGLVGRYAAGRGVKYFRGGTPPRLGDLSATELVYLGP